MYIHNVMRRGRIKSRLGNSSFFVPQLPVRAVTSILNPFYFLFYSTLLYSTLLWCAILCCTVLCYTVLCYAVLCYAVLFYSIYSLRNTPPPPLGRRWLRVGDYCSLISALFFSATFQSKSPATLVK